MTAVTVTSFGYGHAAPPPADLVYDVRGYRDPHLDPALRELTARDPEVREAVMRTPGVAELVERIAAEARSRPPGPLAIAVGCAGGRHRAPVIAEEVARRLGPGAAVSHRDMGRPVLMREAT